MSLVRNVGEAVVLDLDLMNLPPHSRPSSSSKIAIGCVLQHGR
jgi:hypothetical protein